MRRSTRFVLITGVVVLAAWQGAALVERERRRTAQRATRRPSPTVPPLEPHDAAAVDAHRAVDEVPTYRAAASANDADASTVVQTVERSDDDADELVERAIARTHLDSVVTPGEPTVEPSTEVQSELDHAEDEPAAPVLVGVADDVDAGGSAVSPEIARQVLASLVEEFTAADRNDISLADVDAPADAHASDEDEHSMPTFSEAIAERRTVRELRGSSNTRTSADDVDWAQLLDGAATHAPHEYDAEAATYGHAAHRSRRLSWWAVPLALVALGLLVTALLTPLGEFAPYLAGAGLLLLAASVVGARRV